MVWWALRMIGNDLRRRRPRPSGQGLGPWVILAMLLLLIVGQARGDDRWRAVPGHGHLRVHEDGYGNCVFAAEAINPGQESALKFQAEFARPGQVYARCYFPAPVGPMAAEDFWHEIWIDGKIVKRTVFAEPPDPGMDQTQIWITADDYAREMADLAPGVHEVTIWVMKNDRGESGKVKWAPSRLARGDFKYRVR